MLGSAAICMWWDIAPEVRAEWEDWHTHEHMPERLSIPGFLRGSRWVSGNSFFVLYELDTPATLTGAPYLARLNDPTPWSRKMMPLHRNMVRSLCALRDGYGGGIASVLATVRCPAALPLPKGALSAHLLEAQPTPAAQTTEQKIRGGDATAQWILLVAAHDEPAAKAVVGGSSGIVGFYRPAYSLSAGELR